MQRFCLRTPEARQQPTQREIPCPKYNPYHAFVCQLLPETFAGVSESILPGAQGGFIRPADRPRAAPERYPFQRKKG